MKRLILAAVLSLVTSVASAQWQTPSGTIPVGRGAGVTGFNTVGGSGGAGAKCLIDTIPPTFAACPSSASITIGTTLVNSGTNGRVLFDNAGVLGEYTITGTAGSVVLSTSPTITTPVIDQINPSGRSLGVNGATVVAGQSGSIFIRGSDNGVGAGTNLLGINGSPGTTVWAIGNPSSFLASAYDSSLAFYTPAGVSQKWYANGIFSGKLLSNAQPQWVFGNDLTPISTGPIVTVNKNVGTTPVTAGITSIAPLADIVDHVIGLDGHNTLRVMQAFGSGVGNSTIHLHARGTMGSPVASAANDLLAEWIAGGYATAASAGYVGNAVAVIQAIQTETCTTTACGNKLVFGATANGTAAGTFSMTLQRGLAVGTGAADPIDGVVNAGVGFRVANAATSGNVLRGNGTQFVSAALSYSDITGTHNTNTLVSMGSGAVCGTIPQAATSYFGAMGCQSTTEANWQTPASVAFSAKNLRVAVTAAPAAGQTYAFTLRVAGADSALTCTISNPATTCADTSNSVAVSAGNLVNMKVVASATAGAITAANTQFNAITQSP